MTNIILLAPPAAGKGTQAAMISNNYHIPHISTGDLLRTAAKRHDKLARELENILSTGHLVSDDIVLNLLKKRIINKDCKNGYILDGFPRNIDQAEHYNKILDELNVDHGIVILIDVDFEVASSRILGRLLCPSCGLTYNDKIAEMKPVEDNICDKCHSELIRRSDDNIETFKTRFKNYQDKTYPLIEYYQKKNMLYHVDGNQDSESIYRQIDKIINKCSMD